MKSKVFVVVVFTITLAFCQEQSSNASQTANMGSTIVIDSMLRDSMKANLKFVSDRNFSQFKTNAEVRFFANGKQEDSIVEKVFSMMSWYSESKDTIDLVAHVGELETQALLIRFVDHKPYIFFFRAPHEVGGSRRFRINKTDSFSHKIEVGPVHYELRLSEIPDLTNKQVIYGYIDMESGDYYDIRDSDEQKLRVKMKFYFRSQYRKFDY